MKTFFEELNDKIKSQVNSNYKFSKLDYNTQNWIYNLCGLIDEKLKEINKGHK